MASYNQTTNGQSVRIGNWFEELKLKEDTGVRYYPPPSAKSSSLLTKARCIEHSDRIDAKQYTTVTRDTLKDPRQHPQFTNRANACGPKQRLLENSIRAEIEAEIKRKAEAEYKESRVVDYTTTGKQWYAREGFRASLRENDPTVRVQTSNSSYSTDTAITYYSHALKNPNERVSFPATFVGSVNPFSRHNAFSVDIARDTLARRTESNERPRPVPTLTEFKALQAFRGRILAIAKTMTIPTPGAAMRTVVGILCSLQSELIPLEQFSNYISEQFSTQVTSAEEKAFVSAYDYHSNGTLYLPEIIMFFRPTPVRRRAELIEHFFSLMPSPQRIDEDDEHSEVIVTSDVVRNQLKYSSLPQDSPARSDVAAFLDFVGDQFTSQAFHEYCTDISAEIEDDYAFEDYLKSTWDSLLG
eukprot:gene22-27_t